MISNQLRQSPEFRNHERTNAMLRHRQHRIMRGTTTPLAPYSATYPRNGPLSGQISQRTEVVVHTMEVAATLVVPTTCSVNRARRVKRVNAFRRHMR